MKRLATNILAGGLSALMIFTSIGEAQAVPMPVLSVSTSARPQSDVQQVQWHGRGHGHGRYWHRNGGGWGGRHGYYRRGYYGHRHYHRHGGDWVPLAAFAAGAIIAGAASQPAYRGHSAYRSHAAWCASRYRTYRASDNTFQPYNGPRRQCR